jgi:hypothetical protein
VPLTQTSKRCRKRECTCVLSTPIPVPWAWPGADLGGLRNRHSAFHGAVRAHSHQRAGAWTPFRCQQPF